MHIYRCVYIYIYIYVYGCRSPYVENCRDPRRSRLVIPRDVVACLLVSPRSVWVGPLERVGSGSRMYDDGKSGRCQFVGDWTCSIFIDHVAVSDLRSVFNDPSEFADPPSPYSPSDLHPSTSHPTLYSCSASFF